MNANVRRFLKGYDGSVTETIRKFEQIIKREMPGILVELDPSAKIIGYGFGKKYSDFVCVAIPSKKGIENRFLQRQ